MRVTFPFIQIRRFKLRVNSRQTALVDEVNKMLRSRYSEMLYSVTICAPGQLRPTDESAGWP